MTTDKIVHFVYFETLLCTKDFLAKWERYQSSVNIEEEVTLQESKKGDVFTYIAKHCSNPDEFQFVITKGAKLTRSKQTEIKKTQLGGYSILQQEKDNSAEKDECTFFIFLDNLYIDTDIYKQVPSAKLNIYKAYFENCSYTYILEYFIKHTGIAEFKENLLRINTTKPIVYTEIVLS